MMLLTQLRDKERKVEREVEIANYYLEILPM